MEKQEELIDVTESTKKKPPIKKNQIIKKPKQEIAIQSESGALLKLAIDKDLDVDKLEKLIDLKVREEERQCKKDFDFHFNEMQEDYLPVIKEHEVFNKSGTHMYNFAPLEDILKVYAPIVAKHGFSFRWEEESKNEKEKRIYCIISGYGYEKKGYADIPIIPGNDFTNPIQQRGVSTSYGKRISFVNSFGVIIKGQDDDAASLSFDDGVQYADQAMQINNCNTKEELIETWKTVWKNLGTDTIGKQILTIVYNKRKGAIK